MYDRVKDALEQNGELTVRMASGEEKELHLHNVEFLDEPIMKIDAASSVHWVDASQVESFWIHYDH